MSSLKTISRDLKKYDKVTFKNGYSKNARTISFVLKSISCGIGVEKWGAPTDKSVYIISLGSKISNDFEFGKRYPCKSKSIKIYDNCIVYDGKFINFYAKDRDIQSRILVAIIKQIKEESEEIIRQLRCSTENEKQHREYLLSGTPSCFLP